MRNIVILLLLLFVSLCSAQTGLPKVQERIFSGVADDTIGTILTPDSVYIQFYPNSTWKLLTSVISDGDTAMVTADDKVAENTLQFMLARETFWTQSPMIRFEIRNTTQDTITSNWVNVGKYHGAMTLHVVCDTTASRVDYGGSLLTGN